MFELNGQEARVSGARTKQRSFNHRRSFVCGINFSESP